MRKIAAHYVFPVSTPPVRNGLITLSDDGEILDLRQMHDEEEGVEFYSGVLAPGFVNAHCHLELSHLLGEVPEHVGLTNFLFSVVAAIGKFSDEQILRSLSLADAQMYAQGTVAVGDISNHSISFEAKSKSPIFYHTFIEIIDLWKANVDELLSKAQRLLSDAQRCKLSASLTAHAPYTMSAAMLRALAQKSTHMSIHNQECADENLFFEQGRGELYKRYSTLAALPPATGKTSIHYTLENIVEVEKLLLVHNTCTSSKDYDYAEGFVRCLPEPVEGSRREPTPQCFDRLSMTARKPNTKSSISWVLCPRSNLYIENALPPVHMLRAKGANIALGTDSLSSNHSLNMLEELKCLAQNFPNIPFAEALRWATLGGAEALRCEHKFGSLERGKKPGLVLLENFDFDRMSVSAATTSRLLTK
ncbi:MAG: amidohydrolase family protein [Prevotellaceae bacterium]|jgi:cytosine/adenosine deaminase-related metal-dependent hydrolase|nr:amidohydrolase family protein [Prevotellaceae bacterium]